MRNNRSTRSHEAVRLITFVGRFSCCKHSARSFVKIEHPTGNTKLWAIEKALDKNREIQLFCFWSIWILFMPASALELCAGGGGQALGLEQAGFDHVGLVENDRQACETLRANRPEWNDLEHDLFQGFDTSKFKGVDLVAGGLPCPPFSVASKQMGESDERNLFSVGVNLIGEIKPKAVMFENVRGMLEPRFADYRAWIDARLRKMGYVPEWKLLHASDFGVPQLRPRVLLIALKKDFASSFFWPTIRPLRETVGNTLKDLLESNGWTGAHAWAEKASVVAPTIVGGSKKHGGPDLGPTRSRQAWAQLGVDGLGLANEAPGPTFVGMPRLTVRMVARLQGFPDSWIFRAAPVI